MLIAIISGQNNTKTGSMTESTSVKPKQSQELPEVTGVLRAEGEGVSLGKHDNTGLFNLLGEL